MVNAIIVTSIQFIMRMFISRMDICPIRMDIDS